MLPLAHLTVGEWAALAGPALVVAGAVWRGARKIARRIELVLGSIAANSQQLQATNRTVKSLEAQVNVQATAIDGLSVRMDRLDRQGSKPMQETLRILRDKVAPDAQAAREHTDPAEAGA